MVKRTRSCWIWLGGYNSHGYGHFGSKRAHRYAWELANGRKPGKGKIIMHTCDNPGCVNPKHLREGTQRENIHDCMRKGNFPAGSRNGNAKLSIEDVAQIKERVGRGEIPFRLAKEFGVHKKCVYKLLKGRSYVENHGR